MTPTLPTEERLTAIAEALYPIEIGMCAFRRQGVKNERICFVWKMNKQLKALTEVQIKMVLHELESKAGIKPQIHTADRSVDGQV